MNSSKRLASTPGIGRWPPMRYTASIASVKKTRFRRSGIRKTLAIASKNFMAYFSSLLLGLGCLGLLVFSPAVLSPLFSVFLAFLGSPASAPSVLGADAWGVSAAGAADLGFRILS